MERGGDENGSAGQNDPIDIGSGTPDGRAGSRLPRRVLVGLTAAAVLLGVAAFALRSTSSEQGVSTQTDDISAVDRDQSASTSAAPTTTDTEPTSSPTSALVETPAPPAPSPPVIPSLPPTTPTTTQARELPNGGTGAGATPPPDTAPMRFAPPPVGSPIYKLAYQPYVNAKGETFGGGPMTDPVALGLDFSASIEGQTIVGWMRTGDTDIVPGPYPGSPPLGYRMYDSDGVTVLGYYGIAGFTPA